MENCEVSVHLEAADNRSGRTRTSARLAKGLVKPVQCPCCVPDKVPIIKAKRRRSASRANPPQKRKRTSVDDTKPSSQPFSSVSADPAVLGLVPTSHSSIDPAELPVASNVAPSSPQPPTAAVQDDSPLIIHNHSVEEYQKIYHEVVDDMLRYKNGELRPYSLELGRRIKQKLWERLYRPSITTTFTENGLTCINVSYGAGVHLSHFDVDISDEPKPVMPPKQKRSSPRTKRSSTSSNHNSEFATCSSSSPSTSSPPPPPPLKYSHNS